MESFYSLLFVMGVNSVLELDNDYLDIVGKLPAEIAIMILRRLDSRSLLSAAMVNRRWFSLCRSDSVLRAKVKAELRRQRIARIFPTRVKVLRSTENVQPFASMNVKRTIQAVVESGHQDSRNSQVIGSNRLYRTKNKLQSGAGSRKPKSAVTSSKPKKGLRL